MGIIARQSTARTVTVGPVLDADGVAVTGGVVADFKIAKNGGAPAALNASATLTHRHTGFYSLALTASDLDTVGQAEITIDDTVNACPMKDITVIEEAVYDAMFAASAPGYLQPTTAGRTLDVSAGGEAGIDWANVGSPTTTVALTGTTIATTQKVDVETIKTNPVVNAGTVTFPTGATLASTTNITAGTLTTVTTATNVTTVNGLAANVITAASMAADASAEIADAVWDEDATGHQTGGTFGQAIGDPGASTETLYKAIVTDPAGTNIAADIIALKAETATILADTNELQTDWVNGGRLDLILDIIAADVVNLDGAAMRGTDNAALASSLPTNFSALGINVSGHVSRVTLADTLTTYTGNTPQTGDSFARIGAAGAGLTDLGGMSTTMKGQVQTEAEDALVVHRLDELLNADSDIDGAAPPTVGSVFHELMTKTAGSFTYDQTTDSLEAIRDRGDAAWITATGFSTHSAADVWAAGTRTLTSLSGLTVDTVTTLTNLPAITANWLTAAGTAADFGAEIADAVWDELLAGHAGVGSAGAALSAAGSAGDPWSTALPGAYGAGTAGKIIGDNLNATITSRMATYTQPTGFLAATFPTTVSDLTAAQVNTEADTALADYGALKPTTAGRTLDVTATGAAGIDWANVENQGSSVDLTATTVSGVTTVVTVSGNVNGTVAALAANSITASVMADGAIDRATFAADTGLQTIRSNTATGGSTTTVTLDASASSTDDYYKGYLIRVTGGGNLHARVITAYNGTTKVATVSPAFAATASTGDSFAILNDGQALVAAMAADTLTSSALASSAVTEIQSGLSTLDAAGIRTAVGLASANLDTQLAAIDDFLDTEIAAIKAKTDNLPAAPAATGDCITAAGVRTAVGLASANLDTQLGDLPTNAELTAALAAADDAVLAAIAALNNLSAAQVNAEVVDALATDTYAEPTGAPAATNTLAVKLGYLFMALRNKITVTATTKTFCDDGGASEWSKALSDDGTTYTEAEGA